MKPLILASASPRRKEIMANLGLKFRIQPADIIESILDEYSPEEAVLNIACQKAQEIAKIETKGIIIAADTIVVLDGQILGKPADKDEAFEILAKLSNKCHEVMTAIYLIDAENGQNFSHVEISKVFFREIREKEIEKYILSGEPMDKAGAYGIQGLASFFIQRIEGCYFNIVGLPVFALYNLLEKMNINLLEEI